MTLTDEEIRKLTETHEQLYFKSFPAEAQVFISERSRSDCREHWATQIREAQRILTAAGYAIVPLEPTEAMVHAAEDLPPPRMFGQVYRAMLSALRKE